MDTSSTQPLHMRGLGARCPSTSPILLCAFQAALNASWYHQCLWEAQAHSTQHTAHAPAVLGTAHALEAVCKRADAAVLKHVVIGQLLQLHHRAGCEYADAHLTSSRVAPAAEQNPALEWVGGFLPTEGREWLAPQQHTPRPQHTVMSFSLKYAHRLLDGYEPSNNRPAKPSQAKPAKLGAATHHFCVSQLGSQLLLSRRAWLPLRLASMYRPGASSMM